MNTLFILNDPPYGTERSYNAVRLARTLAKGEGSSVGIFLMADAVGCAVTGQVLPNGYYNLERMLDSAIQRGADVALAEHAWTRAAWRQRSSGRRASHHDR